MPNILRYTLQISVVVVVTAVMIAIAQRTQVLLQSDVTYCYEGIKTQSDEVPVANCFSVSPTGQFTRVFQTSLEDEARNNIGYTKGYVIPGFWDGHGHVLGFGEVLQTAQLYNSKSLHETIARVRDYVLGHPKSGTKEDWILGSGWDQAAFGRMPSSSDLEGDDVLKDRYIMLYRVDVHCIWVSNVVLDLLPDPIPEVPGGEVIGKGVFCDNAMDVVLKHAPKADQARLTSYLKSAMKELNRVGIVGVHEAGVTPSNLKLYNHLADTENWTVRIYAMLECQTRNTYCPNDAAKINREDGRLMMRSVKLFGDGALGSWGSAMIDPYTDQPGSTGSLLINGSTIKELTHAWSQAGFQVNIHAIGDLANRYVVDAFESAYRTLCPDKSPSECQRKHRFRIEHAQIIHPDDQYRMFTMGIIPSIQPTHATSDMHYAEMRLGHKRVAREAYRLRSFLSLRPVLGSDFPVEPPNPLHGMYSAVTRRSPRTGKGKGGADEGWYMDEAINMTAALAGFTTGAAYGAFLEGKAGVIQEGAWADWVVLDRPFDELGGNDLLTTRIRETWVGGRQVYRRDD